MDTAFSKSQNTMDIVCRYYGKNRQEFDISRTFPTEKDVDHYERVLGASQQIQARETHPREFRIVDPFPRPPMSPPHKRIRLAGRADNETCFGQIIHSTDLTLVLAPKKETLAPFQILYIVLGTMEPVHEKIRVWHHVPFPLKHVSGGDTLWICNFCLNISNDPASFSRHRIKCHWTHPPGTRIYQDGDLSIFEINGSRHRLYCQHLCLLGKLFLEHKILYYDIGAFFFYVLTRYEKQRGHVLVGYFSRERNPDVPNNLSCIVILPRHQGKGYGQMLVDFSYAQTRMEHRTGGPETPLSEMGFLTYAKYWTAVLVHEFHAMDLSNPPSFQQLAEKTGIHVNHILCTLEWMECLVRASNNQLGVLVDKIRSIRDIFEGKRRINPQLVQHSEDRIKK